MTDRSTKYARVIAELGYEGSENYVTDPRQVPQIAHLLEAAREANVRGAYVFRMAPQTDGLLPPRPAVYVAEAYTEDQARDIHRQVWNQGAVPYLIVVLPSHVRVYTGFQFDRIGTAHELANAPLADWDCVREALSDYFAAQIDAGHIWARSDAFQAEQRVDQHLLRNLAALSDLLVRQRDVPKGMAHTLIGKYIYIRYLRDRSILSDEWLAEHGINVGDVLGPRASRAGLRGLVDALDERFKGSVFPLELIGRNAPSDAVVKEVAGVFAGTDVESEQLALDFKIYDFSYIPIELLSSIYEQFLHVEGKGAAAGAYYTPEPVADYVLAEIHSQHPLQRGARVLDPCCGSGVFLVLAYRRLIEDARLQAGRRLRADELRAILQRSIFGVERNAEACFVAEFSLILTLLSYIEPPELHQNRAFKFPALHNTNIFECDFFDESSAFAQRPLSFDWVVGNPPWLELDGNDSTNRHALLWIDQYRREMPVARARASEAFLWRAAQLLAPNGTAALLVHATSLTNAHSEKFRQAFFHAVEVRRITNFSNLAYDLFAGSAETPAASIVFHAGESDRRRDPIIHYGPFAANQILTRDLARAKPWAITVFEDEISVVSPEDAESGNGQVWKMALWGNYRDVRALARLKNHLGAAIGDLERLPGWSLSLGLQLRDGSIPERERDEPLVRVPELRGRRVLDHGRARRMKWRFTVPSSALEPIGRDHCWVRSGRLRGLQFLKAPHLWLDVGMARFSQEDFVLHHPLIGLAAPVASTDHLRALSLYLQSSLARYIAFFETASWGVDRKRMNINEARRLRVPQFTKAQVSELAKLHRQFAQFESMTEQRLAYQEDDPQIAIDDAVFSSLSISRSDALVASDFARVRLQLDKGKTSSDATRPPSEAVLQAYARHLRDELDRYAGIHHRVTVVRDRDLVACEVRVTESRDRVEPMVLSEIGGPIKDFRALWEAVREQRSQWVYVQRGLRLFDGSSVVICKAARQIDWTPSQALKDSDDIISEVLDAVTAAR